MPIKCGGAPQKLLYLSEESWRNNGVRPKSDIHWYSAAPNMFPNCQKYADALLPIAKGKGIDIHFKHAIKKVDGPNRKVYFQNLEDESMVEVDFDLLHVVPTQTATKEVRESPLAAANGFVDVDKDTLQHNQFPNVFALGDVANCPTAKTASGVFSQSPVVIHNILQVENKKNPGAKYNGY